MTESPTRPSTPASMALQGPGSSVSPSSKLGQLCSKCEPLFRPKENVNIFSEGFTFPDLSFSPKTCCLCAMIWERHECFLKNERLDVELLRVSARVYPNLFYSGTGAYCFDITWQYSAGLYSSATLSAVSELEIPESLRWSTNLTKVTISDSSLSFLTSRLRHCLETHSDCSNNFDVGNTWHPSRLLEIHGADVHIVSLRDRSELQPLPYCSLSHCWGSSPPISLTSDSEESLKAGVPVSSLPKTFRDAVHICSMSGIRYLWIDSMCIQQDSLGDWQKEAASMQMVYSKAIFNIAATSATDSSIGLSFHRNLKAVLPFWVDVKWTDGSSSPYTYRLLVLPFDHWPLDVENGILNKRAWVLQERFLSSRIMHFSFTQVFWECSEERSGEVFAGPESTPEWLFILRHYTGQKTLKLKRSLNMHANYVDQKAQDTVYDGWNQLVTAYAQCEMTNEKDKFVAIQGIVRRIANFTGDRFIAGLWQSHLLRDLLFGNDNYIPSPKQTPRNWRAPTWSWASKDYAIGPSTSLHYFRCLQLRARVTVEHVDIVEEESGELTHATLRLRGKLFHATCVYTERRRFMAKLVSIRKGLVEIPIESRSKDESYDYSFTMYADEPDFATTQKEQIICIAFWYCECGYRDHYPFDTLQGLVLKQSMKIEGTFERIGTFTIPRSGYDFYMENETQEEHSLTLI